MSNLDPQTILRAKINGAVRDYVQNGGKLKLLAAKTGLNYRTISKLAYYETARPQMRTAFLVAEALHIRIRID